MFLLQARKRHQSDLLEQLDYQTALKEEEDHMEKLALVDIKVNMSNDNEQSTTNFLVHQGHQSSLRKHILH